MWIFFCRRVFSTEVEIERKGSYLLKSVKHLLGEFPQLLVENFPAPDRFIELWYGFCTNPVNSGETHCIGTA